MTEVAAAREDLLAWVREAGGMGRIFLQAHLVATGPDRFRLRHRDDVKRPAASLARHTDPYDAREIARTTRRGDHRPLKTAPNLRRGWSFEELDGDELWIALDYLYPACAVHWHAERAGTLRVTPWKETAARQSGIYSAVGLLAPPAVANAVRACCGNTVCLRQVRWGFTAGGVGKDGEVETGEAVIPCPEACSLFISLARAVLGVEREPRREVEGLGSVNENELVQIRRLILATAAGTAGQAREGEVENPDNLRRIRYLAARLG
jgi:hypothetical protein